ncbi:putative mitochondrial chaperone protein DNAj [Leptomonas pyrrhocoris]|uniref:Putative mitochondrial chaperone protein DNAj n=1 Tax=Leptomonas pyrrhocoris TaxID=157538 RepID=A0A0N0DZ69_LEPPY|nr:putative mitochondrial chaperone protein DNAj [Leptomonas pyrrhocoris]XP_015663407.1 putative mitochondrial chaperone protein DNAj [Leptomonas pyrrhocoris]KPA84967.1 putative mitochondrial chaperone protein DNAj [Leptomonas pyrrhocoris]KPA84968.1 putative mitochondrial chaperone protein DNAj [Leptomonas pyrrhocoris]|eukprot:XP_015663406.1 putative mitochondrial chaperone protein DNAj [Leptomonas pyrrhocoris]
MPHFSSALVRTRALVCVFSLLLLLLLLLCVAVESHAFFGGNRFQRQAAPPPQAHRPEVDYYKILNLEGKRETATEREIRQEFRHLSRRYHPDVASTEEDKAKYSEVNRAYEVLSDKRKRKVFDMRGERGLEQLEQIDRAKDQPGGGMNPLAQLFGMRTDDGLRGPNMEVETNVDLSKVFTGAQEPIQIHKHKLCPRCKGTGADNTAPIVTCNQCGGRGMIHQRIQFAPGMIQDIQQQCPGCGGSGKKPERLCPVCQGKKVVYGSSTLTLELEPGTEENHVLKFEMEAEETPDRLPGDLLVHIRTHPHAVFARRRNQLDLDTSLTLTLREALLGFDRRITHLDGVEQVEVRRDGSSPFGTVVRSPGKGMPKLHVPSERGDLYIRLRYDLPERLTEEQKALVEKLL